MPFTYEELCALIDALHDKIQWWERHSNACPTATALRELGYLRPLLSKLEAMADEFRLVG